MKNPQGRALYSAPRLPLGSETGWYRELLVPVWEGKLLMYEEEKPYD